MKNPVKKANSTLLSSRDMSSKKERDQVEIQHSSSKLEGKKITSFVNEYDRRGTRMR